MTADLVVAEDLTKHFPVKLPALQALLTRHRPVVHAVDGVTFALKEGEIFGVVGESGCGKTTLGRTVLRLTEPTSGTIRFLGQDITRLKDKELRPIREAMQIVFQDPHASLNPAMTIGQSIADALLAHRATAESEAKEAVLRILTEVGLSPADQLYGKYPADLSGGQKQRAVIARALILRPKLIVADEPVAMLDMSIRARILELMLDLKDKYGLTYLFITHDLATAKFICNRIAIMYLGRVVEVGDAKEIYRDPKHPYTRALLGAIPIPDPDRRRLATLPKGEVPDAINPPTGCRFHPRCPVATPECGWEPNDLFDLLDRRALDPAARMRDEAMLGPRDEMTVEDATLRVPVRARGLTHRETREAVTAVLLASLAFLVVNVGAGLGIAAAGLVAILAVTVLARREFITRLGRPDPEKVRGYLEGVLRTAPEPMGRAVRRIAVEGNRVLVEFAPAMDPGLRTVEGREVRCVLY